MKITYKLTSVSTSWRGGGGGGFTILAKDSRHAWSVFGAKSQNHPLGS